ncbi:preprotein translocase subunit SecE [bacterium]|nr:preprotein translocase subunit SecE [bacterium]
MNSHKKYVNFLLMAAGAVIWFLSQHFTEFIIGRFQLGRQIGVAADVLYHALPILLGVGTYLYFRLNTKIYHFCSDSMSELIKVHFPTGKEVRMGTIVVIITVLVSGVLLGALDFAINAVVKAILGA